MANYTRAIKTDIWINKEFRKMMPQEKIFWFYLHTGYHSSETALYACPIEDIALFCGISKKKAKEMIEKFCEQGSISYDFMTDELLVKDYFNYHPPIGGLYYRMYSNDLAKIKSQRLIDELVEISKKHKISLAFFAALRDLRPELDPDEFKIKKTDKTEVEIRNADERGRGTAAENRTMAEIVAAAQRAKAAKKSETNNGEEDFFEGMEELF